MGQSVSVKWDGSPQKAKSEGAEASIVFSSLLDDPHGQVRTPRSQCACEPDVWSAIVQLATEHLQYTQPCLLHSPKRNPMAEQAKDLIAKMTKDHQPLRFSYCAVWVTWNTNADGRRIPSESLNHWEHVLRITNPAGPIRTAGQVQASEKKGSPHLRALTEFPDFRQAIDPSLYKHTKEPLLPLPPSLCGMVRQESDDTEAEDVPPSKPQPPSPDGACGCIAGLMKSMFGKGSKASRQPQSKQPPPECRWYKVYPVQENGWLLKPDPGPRSGSLHAVMPEAADADSPSSKLQRRMTLPISVEKHIDMEEPSGFDCDAFTNCCRICFEQTADVVAIPCGHGGLCEDCLRRTLLSRPKHRGGRQCPFCRKNIEEVGRLHQHGGVQYVFVIKML